MSIEDSLRKAQKQVDEAFKEFWGLPKEEQERRIKDEENKLITTEESVYPQDSTKRKVLLQRRAAMYYANEKEKYEQEVFREAAE